MIFGFEFSSTQSNQLSMCHQHFAGEHARFPDQTEQMHAAGRCRLRGGATFAMQNAIVLRLLGGLLVGLLVLFGPQARAVTLAELRADAKLTPERFIKYFAGFKFELSRTVRKPEVFLESQTGDC